MYIFVKTSTMTTKIIFNIDSEYKKKLQIEALNRGVSLTELIIKALEKEVNPKE